MDPTLLFGAILVCLVVLLVLEVPVGISLMGVSVIGLIVLKGPDVAMNTLGSLPFNSTASYSLAVVPLYVLTGTIAAKAGLAKDLFSLASYYLHRLPGGLGMSGIAGCAGFAAVTGSSVATVASVGRTAIYEMRRHGYHDSLSTGAIAAAGTLGILIPPSVVLVLYGITTGTSIGALLIAGIVPGILSAVAYGLVVYLLARRRPELAGRGSGAEVAGPPRPGQAEFVSLAKVLILFGIIVGGVYTGFYTATEAGAIGTVAALVMLVMADPRRALAGIRDALIDGMRLTSSLFLILVGGMLFTYLIVSLRIPRLLAEWAVGLPVPAWVIVALALLAMVPLGMLLDSISILLVFVPIVFPIIDSLGFNAIWFGILTVKLIEIGLVTPPVGMNVFVIAGTVRGVTAEQVFRAVIPFIAIDFLFVAMLFVFPQIVLFLPGLMR